MQHATHPLERPVQPFPCFDDATSSHHPLLAQLVALGSLTAPSLPSSAQQSPFIPSLPEGHPATDGWVGGIVSGERDEVRRGGRNRSVCCALVLFSAAWLGSGVRWGKRGGWSNSYLMKDEGSEC